MAKRMAYVRPPYSVATLARCLSKCRTNEIMPDSAEDDDAAVVVAAVALASACDSGVETARTSAATRQASNAFAGPPPLRTFATTIAALAPMLSRCWRCPCSSTPDCAGPGASDCAVHTCEIVARPLTWRQARVALLWARAGTRHALLHAWTLAYAADDDGGGGAFPFTRTPRMWTCGLVCG